jgi:hypothetical protein
MFYFKFEIPNNKDGTVVTYSPGWCGTRDKCALNETGLLYNDEEGWGVGQAEGDFIPPDVEVLTEKEALKLVKAADSTNPKVFTGLKLKYREWGKVTPKVVYDVR